MLRRCARRESCRRLDRSMMMVSWVIWAKTSNSTGTGNARSACLRSAVHVACPRRARWSDSWKARAARGDGQSTGSGSQAAPPCTEEARYPSRYTMGPSSDLFGGPSALLRNICCTSSIFMSVAGRTTRSTAVHADVRYVSRRLNAVNILMSCLRCISSFEVSVDPVHPVVQGLTQEKAKDRGNPRKRARDRGNITPPLEQSSMLLQ